MIWDAIYMALNSTIGGTLEPLDAMVKRLKNELNSTITTGLSSLQTAIDDNHGGYKAIFEEYEDPGSYHINVPYGAKKVKVTANAGGGGLGYTSAGYDRYGGNGASLTNHEYSVTGVSHFILTIGSGGHSGSSNYGVPGGDGGDTVIGNLATLKGGGGGAIGTSYGANGTGGDGATVQSSLNYANRGKGGSNGVSPNGTDAKRGYGYDGFCRLEWIF